MNDIENFAPAGKPKILIAEDDPTSEALIKRILANYAREILVAGTGIDAVDICQRVNDIDIILMDMRMPGIDGYEATRKIREFNKKVFIIAQTAYALTGDEAKSLQAGCDVYITKPISRVVLMEHINNYTKTKTFPPK